MKASKSPVNHIIVLEPITDTFRSTLKLVTSQPGQENFKIIYTDNPVEAMQLTRQHAPCLVGISIQAADRVVAGISFIRSISDKIDAGEIKVLAVNKFSTDGLTRALEKLKLSVVLTEPIPSRTLLFKVLLQIRALDVIRQRIEMRAKQNERIAFEADKDDSKRGDKDEAILVGKKATPTAQEKFNIQKAIANPSAENEHKIAKTESEGTVWQKKTTEKIAAPDSVAISADDKKSVADASGAKQESKDAGPKEAGGKTSTISSAKEALSKAEETKFLAKDKSSQPPEIGEAISENAGDTPEEATEAARSRRAREPGQRKALKQKPGEAEEGIEESGGTALSAEKGELGEASAAASKGATEKNETEKKEAKERNAAAISRLKALMAAKGPVAEATREENSSSDTELPEEKEAVAPERASKEKREARAKHRAEEANGAEKESKSGKTSSTSAHSEEDGKEEAAARSEEKGEKLQPKRTLRPSRNSKADESKSDAKRALGASAPEEEKTETKQPAQLNALDEKDGTFRRDKKRARPNRGESTGFTLPEASIEESDEGELEEAESLSAEQKESGSEGEDAAATGGADGKKAKRKKNTGGALEEKRARLAKGLSESEDAEQEEELEEDSTEKAAEEEKGTFDFGAGKDVPENTWSAVDDVAKSKKDHGKIRNRIGDLEDKPIDWSAKNAEQDAKGKSKAAKGDPFYRLKTEISYEEGGWIQVGVYFIFLPQRVERGLTSLRAALPLWVLESSSKPKSEGKRWAFADGTLTKVADEGKLPDAVAKFLAKFLFSERKKDEDAKDKKKTSDLSEEEDSGDAGASASAKRSSSLLESSEEKKEKRAAASDEDDLDVASAGVAPKRRKKESGADLDRLRSKLDGDEDSEAPEDILESSSDRAFQDLQEEAVGLEAKEKSTKGSGLLDSAGDEKSATTEDGSEPLEHLSKSETRSRVARLAAMDALKSLSDKLKKKPNVSAPDFAGREAKKRDEEAAALPNLGDIPELEDPASSEAAGEDKEGITDRSQAEGPEKRSRKRKKDELSTKDRIAALKAKLDAEKAEDAAAAGAAAESKVPEAPSALVEARKIPPKAEGEEPIELAKKAKRAGDSPADLAALAKKLEGEAPPEHTSSAEPTSHTEAKPAPAPAAVSSVPPAKEQKASTEISPVAAPSTELVSVVSSVAPAVPAVEQLPSNGQAAVAAEASPKSAAPAPVVQIAPAAPVPGVAPFATPKPSVSEMMKALAGAMGAETKVAPNASPLRAPTESQASESASTRGLTRAEIVARKLFEGGGAEPVKRIRTPSEEIAHRLGSYSGLQGGKLSKPLLHLSARIQAKFPSLKVTTVLLQPDGSLTNVLGGPLPWTLKNVQADPGQFWALLPLHPRREPVSGLVVTAKAINGGLQAQERMELDQLIRMEPEMVQAA